MKLLCAPTLARRLLLAGIGSAMLAACATEPAPPPPADAPAQQQNANDTLKAHAVQVAALRPEDPGIAALARAISGAQLVSFAGDWAHSQEDESLKSALTEALVQSGRLGLLVLNVPCEGAEMLDTYASGAATSALAADVVRSAPIPEGQKTAALTDILTVLRGWNAVNPDKSVKVSGMHCKAAASADPERVSIFWGLDQLPAHTGEKDLAASALQYGDPSGNHVWLVQTDDEGLSGILPASGWIDLRALPATADVVSWRQEKAATEPLLRPQHPSAADILFRHAQRTPADPF
ncbi:MAG: hypothetical protein C0456_09155 [Hyphomonas sp.]|uniref:hypothetical protein n=1 Tax=Hyphomonas sp. TaxID=87 RepID=UPI001D57DF19|nr:hypothetical protein [Hyphomonas sp.]MBA4226787.1 hypothetical protein [Hyphomonas sp.]